MIIKNKTNVAVAVELIDGQISCIKEILEFDPKLEQKMNYDLVEQNFGIIQMALNSLNL